MAVGTLPVAAIAETAGVETQAASTNSDFNKGVISIAVNGAEVTQEDAKTYSMTYDGKAHTVGTLSVTADSETFINNLTLTAYNQDFESEGVHYSVALNKDGATGTVDAIKDAGTYHLTVTRLSDGATVSTTIRVAKRSVKSATAATLEYNSDNLKPDLAVSVDGIDLTQGTDYTVTKVNKKQADGSWADNNGVIDNAGDYQVTISGVGNFKDDVTISVTVSPLDLSKATITLTNANGSDWNATYVESNSFINGKTIAQLGGGIKVTGNGTVVLGHEYEYVFRSDDTNANIAKGSSKTLTSTQTEWVVNNGDVKYGTQTPQKLADDTDASQVAAAATTIDLDASPAQKFDASKIDVTATSPIDSTATTETLEASQYTVTYEQLVDGEWVASSADQVNNGGIFRASVKVDTAKGNYKYQGGTADGHYLYFNVVHSQAATVYVSYNGKTIGYDWDSQNTSWPTYDGNDRKGDFKITVKDYKGNNLAEGVDYKVEYKRVDANDAQKISDTSEIKDAGNYRIVVTALRGRHFTRADNTDYTVDTTNVWVKQKPVTVSLSKANQTIVSGATKAQYAYTGSAVVPQFEFADSNSEAITVPADQYTVTYTTADDNPKTVDSITAAGHYTVTVAMPNGGNYTLRDSKGSAASETFAIEVSEDRSFSDVANDAWYAQVVSIAKEKGYVHGVGGTTMFAPEASITRGDVVTILWNAAKAAGKVPAQYSSDANTSFDTGFSDVDGSKYYAQAIAWAKATGVVNGYGDGTFKPEQNVTREEFASMLANYAKANGDYTPGNASDIASLPDASAVSDWAVETVAWAVNNKVMGNGGFINPQGNVTRAETAAMVVNYFVK